MEFLSLAWCSISNLCRLSMSADVMCKSCGFSLYVSCRNCNTNAGYIIDRPLLNTKWMLPNSTIVLSMWFIIRSNSFTVWDISFILQKLLHSSMIPGVSSLNLHEYGMADVSTASISFSRHTITCSLVFFHTSIGIRSDHMYYPTSSYPAALILISSTDIGGISPSVFRAFSSCPFVSFHLTIVSNIHSILSL